MANYLKNEDLLNELILSKSKGDLTKNVIKYFNLMIDKIGTEFSYEFAEDRQDCRSEAMLNVLKYWRTFDINITTNAFSWFTQTIKTGYTIGFNRITKKRKRNISISNFEELNF